MLKEINHILQWDGFHSPFNTVEIFTNYLNHKINKKLKNKNLKTEEESEENEMRIVSPELLSPASRTADTQRGL